MDIAPATAQQTFPPLFAVASTGTIKQWQVEARQNPDGTAAVVKHFGLYGGQIQENIRIVKKGKNIGRANETTAFEQAVSEAQSAWNKKKDEKYIEQLPQAGGDTAPEIFLPMLAHPFQKRGHNITWPAFAQPKFNGVRVLARRVGDDIIYTSRKGKVFTTLRHLDAYMIQILADGEILDGEAYVHDWTFQQIIRAVKKLRPESAQLQFWAYDFAKTEMPYAERLKWLIANIAQGNATMKVAPTFIIRTPDEVKKHHDRFVQDGYEGAMIRNALGHYRFDYRSPDLQKYKEFIDAEFEIIGGKEGVGNDAGCVIFTIQAAPGLTCDVRPKGSVEQRQKWFSELPSLIGKQLTVRYQEKSEDGNLIFPVGIAIRDYED